MAVTRKTAATKPPARKVHKRTGTARKPRLTPEQIMAEVEDDIVLIEQNRTKAKELSDEASKAQTRVNEAFERAKISNHKVKTADGVFTATFVAGTTISIDEDKLRKKIGAALWNKITTRMMDKKKLDAFVASGEIPATTLAACSDELPKTPYTKVVRKSG